MRRPSDVRTGLRGSELRFSSESVDRRVSDRLLMDVGESVASLPLVAESEEEVVVAVAGAAAAAAAPPSPGTSRLDLLMPSMGPMLILVRSPFSVGLVWTGKRPTLLSRWWEPVVPAPLGAGEVALLREPPAAFSNNAR